MSKKIDIDNKVKESFDAAEASAPSGIWEGIADDLDASSSHSALDSRVKESFEGNIAKAPDKVWEKVNRQLNIDKVWKRTLSSLIRITLFRRIRRVAALLILLLLGWGAYKNFEGQPLAESEQSLSADVSDAGNSNEEKGNSEQELGDRSTEVISEPLSDVNIEDETSSHSSNSDIAEETASASGTVNAISSSSDALTGRQIANPSMQQSTTATSTSFEIEQISEEVANSEVSQTILAVNSEADNSQNVELHIMTSLDLSRPFVILPSPEMPKDSASSSKNKLRNRAAIGFTYSYNNTWLLNNETSEAFDPNSLVSTTNTYAASYGLEGTIKVAATQSIAAQFYINSRVKQDYGLYLEGKHTSKKVQVDYMKFVLMYKMSCPQINSGKNAICAVQLGPYMSRLKNQSVYHDDKITAVESDYQDIDWGVKVAIGQDVQIDRYIISYGLNGEYGLVNIFAGQGRISPKFDITRNAHIGAYLSAKYQF